jgi:hypothetical protein
MIISAVALAAAWKEIDCSKSKVQVYPGASCAKQQFSGGQSARVQATAYATRGYYNGVIFNMTASVAGRFTTYIKPKTEKKIIARIKEFNNVTQERSDNWSAHQNVGSISYMTFEVTDADLACFGFYKTGPARFGGYASDVAGFFCNEEGDITIEQIKEYTDQIKLE